MVSDVWKCEQKVDSRLKGLGGSEGNKEVFFSVLLYLLLYLLENGSIGLECENKAAVHNTAKNEFPALNVLIPVWNLTRLVHFLPCMLTPLKKRIKKP